MIKAIIALFFEGNLVITELTPLFVVCVRTKLWIYGYDMYGSDAALFLSMAVKNSKAIVRDYR